MLYTVFHFELTHFYISIVFFLSHKQNLLKHTGHVSVTLTLFSTRGDHLTMEQNHPFTVVSFKGLPSQRAEAFKPTLKTNYRVALCHGS